MKTKILFGLTLMLSATLSMGSYAQSSGSSNLPDHYLKNLKNYEFKNTRGMEELNPERISWVHNEYQDPDNWESLTVEDKKRLEELGITFPNFSFIENTDTVAANQKRQRTHTVEHILYAMPGDALSLYPYYGLEETTTRYWDKTDRYPTKNYFETFSHWYDFRNGGRVQHTSKNGKVYDLLDFPADRHLIQISDDYGFYGGIYMSPGTQDNNNKGQTYSVATPQEYIDAVNAINGTGGKGSIILTANLDFKDYSNVPMLGDIYEHRFGGIFNGQGYTISNLKISHDDGENIGLIGTADDGAMIVNLIIDSSCTFEGRLSIGLVGKLDQGHLTVRNVSMNATVRGTRSDVGEQFASAILGRAGHNGADNYLVFEDIYIGGTVGNEDSGEKYDTALCGWLFTGNTKTNSTFKNIVVNGTIHGPENLTGAKYLRRDLSNTTYNNDTENNVVTEQHPGYSIIYTDCYGNVDPNDEAWITFTELPQIEGWLNATTPGIYTFASQKENLGGELLKNSWHRTWHEGNDEEKARRIAGTSAVFYFPDNDDLGDEWMKGTKEYVVAADFSQTFEPGRNLDIEQMTITEPIVAFRHIFRIRDGRAQAKEIYEDNRGYIRKRQHKVSARSNANFQIRLDFPLPTNWGTSGGVTNYYYAKADGSYDRVKQFTLRVLNGDRVETENPGFECGADIQMRRAEPCSDRTHAQAIPDKKLYHTMLHIDKNKVADNTHYIVQIIAKDDSGNILKTKDGSDMVIMEYDITFLPEEGASMVTESELYDDAKTNNNKFLHARDSYLKERYGDPADVIDFDNFFKLNKLPESDNLRKKTVSFAVPARITDKDWVHPDFPVYGGKSEYDGNIHKRQHSFYKWPISWNRSTYAFGYNYRYDYNMYMLATHSENVPYHVAANGWKDNIDGDGDGLYDRLYYKTKRLKKADQRVNVEQGYFYYVNAASDPGVTARLNFNISCPGSRVIVSAWLAEMSPAGALPDDGTKSGSQDEPANLSFNFVAVMKGTNERVTLHNFITGYVGEKSIYGDRRLEKPDQLGKWLNVYYSFVPRLAEFYNDTKTFADVDHFELELAHNGMSSAGSDYAVDDIRAYVVPPYSEADHDGYACEDSPLKVEIQTSFETLLEKSGEAEAFKSDSDEDVKLYYAFVDKEMVDEGAPLESAFVPAVVSEGELPFGQISFSNYYKGNDAYSDANPVVNNKAYRYTADSGDRMILFKTEAAAGSLRLGKEYYVVFRTTVGDGDVPTEGSLAKFFDLGGECSYSCSMIVKPSLKIKIDGVIEPEFDNITVCENQSPVIQVNVWSTDTDPEEVQKNAYFDWFDGSINDYNNYRFVNYSESREIEYKTEAPAGSKTLRKALEVFRSRYEDAEGVAGIKPETTPDQFGDMLEQWMLDIISIATSRDAGGRQRLWLHQPSFVLPPVDLGEKETKRKAKVVAIPITSLYTGKGDHQVCPSPTELGITIAHRTPVLLHGLRNIDYPSGMTDVPLRVGINQLAKNGAAILEFEKNQLDMPIRKALSSDGEERDFLRVQEEVIKGVNVEKREGCIILAQTNDPEYRNLGTVNDKGEETGHLLWVGEISRLVAKSTVAEPSATDPLQYFIAQFDDNFHFKEGYFYRMRFSFEQKPDDEVDADEETICLGHDIFTIKVVPEYVRWTGDLNLSWDNDDNWERIKADDLKAGDDSRISAHLLADGQFDGEKVNNGLRGYAPLGYTKVILDRPTVNGSGADVVVTGENPWLYTPSKLTKEIRDSYKPSKKNNWTENPVATPVEPDEESEWNEYRIGAPTSLIQYDMTATVYIEPDIRELRCLPWTANTCEEIHFLPGATIMNQQELTYGRAWVDMELDHSRWYLLSAPLQDVYAGDFYLPSDNARQETELFRDITFNTGTHNRFKPAVYQRGWDKATANVYEYGSDEVRNAAVRTFWSHVYNDVTENYGSGTAFSIKTDVSRMATVPGSGDKVLFRLPKADVKYKYYDADEVDKSGHETDELSKENAYRLNVAQGTLTSSTASTGKYFLVGNPFMTHMDIRKFIEKNTDKLEPRYWVITEAGQIAGSVTDAGIYAATPYPATDDYQDATIVAPMQGFFVEAKTPATSLTLQYNAEMMRRYDQSKSLLTEATRGNSEAPAIRILASDSEGRVSTSALLLPGIDYPEACVDAFDNRELGISSTVFTARGGRAMSVNLCEDAEGVEVGVIAADDAETILEFEYAEAYEDMCLADRETRTITPLPEVGRLKVTGSVTGRFFLTAGMDAEESFGGLEWSVEGDKLTVKDMAATGRLEVEVYDVTGQQLSEAVSDSDTVTVKLSQGISVVRMYTEKEEKTVKILR